MGEEKTTVFGLSPVDMAYLTEEQRSIIEEELKKEHPNHRIFRILKRFASISKRVEGFTTYFKGFAMDTDAMSWIVSSYQSMPPGAEGYSLYERAVSSYTKVQIWLGYFFSLVNSMNHDLNMRKLTSAEKVLRKLELEVERGRHLFKEFNDTLKSIRNMTVEQEEEQLTYFK